MGAEQKPHRIPRRTFNSTLGFALGELFPKPELINFKKVPLIRHGDRRSNCVSITIDDGWDSKNVERMVEILSGDPATFFIVGALLDQKPELYQEIIDRGLEVCNHTWRHLDLSKLSYSEIIDQIMWWEIAYRKLKRGYPHRILRLPQNMGTGSRDVFTAAAVLKYEAVVQWSLESDGYRKDISREEAVSQATTNLQGGDIILMHATNIDVEALPEIIWRIKAGGFDLVTLKNMPGLPNIKQTKAYPADKV